MKKWAYLWGFLFFGLALVFRFQMTHVPFWVDEFSSAYQANLLLKYGLGVLHNPNFYFEYQNITTHTLIALSFKFFGQSEFTARFPMMLIGSLVPVALYYFGKKVFDQMTGIVASVLSIFSYFMITWSRQARGYVLQQLLVILLFWSYFLAIEKSKHQRWWAFAFFLLSVLGIFTHTMFAIAIFAVALHFVFFQRKKVFSVLKTPWPYLFFVVVAIGAMVTGLASEVFSHVLGILTGHLYNNVWFYHSFLWREYSLITFLAMVGFGIGLLTKRKETSLFVLFIFGQLTFLCFFFGPYVTRYLLPIFPFLLLGMSFALTSIWQCAAQSLPKKTVPQFVVWIVPLLCALFIVINGDKFTIKPKSFYSVDHDFREIALIDYDQIYALIRTKGRLNEGKTAVIDTWGDRLIWYMGEDFRDGYMFRWINGEGLMKQTAFAFNPEGERIFPNRNDVKFVGDVSDLQKVMKKYPRGFIWIDDTTLPADVLAFVEKNMTKEMTLDHFTLDDNPLSLWPGTLYSWGTTP